jgi:multicomponent K+:H+ antiporter subunit C
MELLLAGLIGLMTTGGVFLLLRGQTFTVVVGLTLFTYAINLFLFSMGRLHSEAPPILGVGDRHTDPLPQALVLTAIVISFAMTAFSLVLALRARSELGHDGVDEFAHSPERSETTAQEGPP